MVGKCYIVKTRFYVFFAICVRFFESCFVLEIVDFLNENSEVRSVLDSA